MAQIGVFTSEGLPQWSWSEEDAALGHGHDCDACSPDSGSFDSACSSPDARAPTGHAKHAHQRPKVKMSMRRRMKASEREKLRMRSLAEALHQLRDYLPAGYSKQGQPLTKIQTLKSTIQYIKELASLLEHE